MVLLVFDEGVVVAAAGRVTLVHDDCVKPVDVVVLPVYLLLGGVLLRVQSQVLSVYLNVFFEIYGIFQLGAIVRESL